MKRREEYAVDLADERIKAGNGMKEHKNVTICQDEGKKTTSRLYEINFVLSINLEKLERDTPTMLPAS